MMFLERIAQNPMFGGAVSSPRALLRVIYQDMFGERDLDTLFPPIDDESISQFEENMVMAQGVQVDVRPYDNHVEHSKVMALALHSSIFNKMAESIKSLFVLHAKQHEVFLERAAEKQQSQTGFRPPFQGAMPPQGGPPAAQPPGVQPELAGAPEVAGQANMMGEQMRQQAQGV
jgi:hypothetical protein